MWKGYVMCTAEMYGHGKRKTIMSNAPVPLYRISARTRTNWPFELVRVIIRGGSSAFLPIRMAFLSCEYVRDESTNFLNMFKTFV